MTFVMKTLLGINLTYITLTFYQALWQLVYCRIILLLHDNYTLDVLPFQDIYIVIYNLES